MFFGSRFGAIKPVKVCEPGSARPRPRAWREIIGDPARADANLDRLVHNARRIEFSRASLRRARHSELKTARPKSTPDEKPSSANKAGPLAASFHYGGGISRDSLGAIISLRTGGFAEIDRVRTRYPAAGLRPGIGVPSEPSVRLGPPGILHSEEQIVDLRLAEWVAPGRSGGDTSPAGQPEGATVGTAASTTSRARPGELRSLPTVSLVRLSLSISNHPLNCRKGATTPYVTAHFGAAAVT